MKRLRNLSTSSRSTSRNIRFRIRLLGSDNEQFESCIILSSVCALDDDRALLSVGAFRDIEAREIARRVLLG